MSIRCRLGLHKWGRWDWRFPFGKTQGRWCLRCKLIETRAIDHA